MSQEPHELPGGSDISALSYEESRAALEAVVGALERGNTSLEQSLALWERGEALAQRCQTWLDGARERIAAAAEPTANPSAAED
jgi:exodeoxyribonuclease VII small subunit